MSHMGIKFTGVDDRFASGLGEFDSHYLHWRTQLRTFKHILVRLQVLASRQNRLMARHFTSDKAKTLEVLYICRQTEKQIRGAAQDFQTLAMYLEVFCIYPYFSK